MNHTGAITYLEQEIRPSIITDVIEVAAYHGRRQKLKDAGHHSTPRQVFCYTDHLGSVAFGGTSCASGVRFVEEFFPSRYRPLADLVYAMWRHGTVHAYKPYSYAAELDGVANRRVEVRWLSTNHNRRHERNQHMLVFPMEGKPNAVYLVMNSCQLADDLLAAVDAFLDALRADDSWARQCAERTTKLAEVRECTDIQGTTRAARVRGQIGFAWAHQGGLLDSAGSVKEAHPQSPATHAET